jgi:hypothetical protein
VRRGVRLTCTESVACTHDATTPATNRHSTRAPTRRRHPPYYYRPPRRVHKVTYIHAVAAAHPVLLHPPVVAVVFPQPPARTALRLHRRECTGTPRCRGGIGRSGGRTEKKKRRRLSALSLSVVWLALRSSSSRQMSREGADPVLRSRRWWEGPPWTLAYVIVPRARAEGSAASVGSAASAHVRARTTSYYRATLT